MTEGTYRALSGRDKTEETGVRSLAQQVLSELAGRLPARPVLLDDRLLLDLCAAVQAIDPKPSSEVLARLRAAGLADEDIVEVYIPAAARRLGAAWCEDGIGFAEVTIGTARLQGMVRHLNESIERTPALPDSPTVLTIVPEGESHTLGAMVATGQLRRMGASVRMCVGQTNALVLDLVESCRFDLIMISVAHTEKLEHIRKLVVDIRHALPMATPVIVGGAVVDEAPDVKTQTGADHAVKDAKEALRLCGLRISSPSASRPRAAKA